MNRGLMYMLCRFFGHNDAHKKRLEEVWAMARRAKKSKSSKKKQPLAKSLGRTAITGLFGGFFWASIGLVCYLLNFSKIGPALLFDPFPYWSWRSRLSGQMLAVAGISVLSVFVAMLYLVAFSRIKSMWFSIGFGLCLWGGVFFLCRPFLNHLPHLKNLDLNTLITSLCLFALYGLFIGYSISFDFEEQNSTGNSYSNQ